MTEGAGPQRTGPRGAGAPPSGERLFRRRALERYAHRGEESVLPRLARPPVFVALWVLLALLVILGSVVGALPVADERVLPLVITADGARLVVPADPAAEAAVSGGDPLRCVLAGTPRHGRVGAVGEVWSPEALRERLGVELDGVLDVDGPRRTATVELDGALDLHAFRGAVVEARVTVDRPRAVELLPGVGPWFAQWLPESTREKPAP